MKTASHVFIALWCCSIVLSQDITWAPSSGPYSGTVFDLSHHEDGLLLAGTSLGPVVSTDNGQTWESNLTLPDVSTGSVCVAPSATLFAGQTHRGLFRSTDAGNTWISDSLLGTTWIYAIEAKSDGTVFVGTDDNAFRSSDDGMTWENISTGLEQLVSVYAFTFPSTPDVVIAGTGGGLYRSTNNGGKWSKVANDLITGAVFTLGVNHLTGTILAATNSIVYRSTDVGLTWSVDTVGLNNVAVGAIKSDSSGNLYAGASGLYRGMYHSTDDGLTWISLKTDLPDFAGSVFDIQFLQGNGMMIGTSEGMYYSSDSGISWTPRNTGLTKTTIQSVSVLSNGTIYASTATHGTHISSDLGDSWTRLEHDVFQSGSGHHHFESSRNGDLFAGTPGEVLRSTNGGISWDTLTGGLPAYTAIKEFEFDTAEVVYAAGKWGIYKSTNNGTWWWNVSNNIGPNISDGIIEVTEDGVIIAGTIADMVTHTIQSVDRSTDGGETWTAINSGLGGGLNGPFVLAMTLSPDEKLYAVVSSATAPTRLYRSTNLGDEWLSLPFDSTISISFIETNSDGHVFIGGDGVYRSLDAGTSWEEVIDGLRYTEVLDLGLSDDGFAFVGSTTGLFRTIQPTTDIGLDLDPVPNMAYLSQNYPNPFNPSTTIRFSLPHSGNVTLRIFNLLGEEVATLVSGHREAGTHIVTWDATGHPSGVYFYRLQAGDFVETKKLVLVR